MISPKIVKVISDTFLRSNWQFDYVHNANLNGRADEDWIATFARTGGNAIISGDRAMLKRPELVRQISQTGITAVYLPSKWAQSRREHQMAYCLHWWRRIETHIEESTPGTVLICPNGMGIGDLREHVDKRKLRRAEQEANRKV
jgi:hypothetical protein